MEVTRLLDRAREGGAEAVEELVVAVYRELRGTARSMLRKEPRDITLVPTDLVHETFLRLFGRQATDWENSRHFFGSAAIAMRRVLIDHARSRRAGHRIPKGELVTLDLKRDSLEIPNLDLLALDRALDVLASEFPRQAQVVELRFFAGLTEGEVAKLLDVSRMTVSRDWKVARLRLLREMGG